MIDDDDTIIKTQVKKTSLLSLDSEYLYLSIAGFGKTIQNNFFRRYILSDKVVNL